jgi:hypothetical protein
MNTTRITPQFTAVALLLMVQLICFALVNAKGHFPTNDDWAYAHSVQWLLSEGKLRLSNWIAMNLLPQTLIGAAAASLFGYSLQTLRGVMQVGSLIVSVQLFFWFRQHLLEQNNMVKAADWPAFWISLALIALPWWMPLANSYMTEMLSLILLLGTLSAMRTAIVAGQSVSWSHFILIALLLIVATLQRQTALAFGAAFFLSYLLQGARHSRLTRCLALLPLVLAYLANAVYLHQLSITTGVPTAQIDTYKRLSSSLTDVLRNQNGALSWSVFLLSTWVLLTATCCLFWLPRWQVWQAQSRQGKAIAITLSIGLCALLVKLNWILPFQPNHVLGRFGLGPQTYAGGMQGLIDTHASNATWFWYALTGLTAWCLVALGQRLSARFDWQQIWASSQQQQHRWFLLLSVLGYCAPFLITDFFDRYVFFILPVVWALLIEMGLIGPVISRFSKTLIALCLISSVVLAHDYFAWQKARWRAIEHAVSLGANAGNLDGGFEYNGYFGRELFGGIAAPGKSWWWVQDDRFRVSLSVLPGHERVGTFKAHTWLPIGPQAFILSQRQSN